MCIRTALAYEHRQKIDKRFRNTLFNINSRIVAHLYTMSIFKYSRLAEKSPIFLSGNTRTNQGLRLRQQLPGTPLSRIPVPVKGCRHCRSSATTRQQHCHSQPGMHCLTEGRRCCFHSSSCASIGGAKSRRGE